LCLKEELPPMRKAAPAGQGLWAFLKGYLTDPLTWKSPVFLLLKFPLSTATFSILVILVTLTLALLTLPLTYERMDVQFGGFFSPGRAIWRVDGTWEALLGTAIGLVLWPATLWIVNALAWLHGKFARIMLSAQPLRFRGNTPP
ncbi:MAG: sensor domain-containing protein, partial [Anaerolineae bacterium]